MESLLLTLAFLTGTIVASPSHIHIHQNYHLSPRTSELSKNGFKTTFLDTFTPSAASSLPSSSDWLFDLGSQYPGGAERWGNNEFQVYTNKTENIRVTKEGTLVITPLGVGTGVGNWTSARIETRRTDFKAVEGGKLWVEARVKLRSQEVGRSQGIWPAFWTLGEKFRTNNTYWPMSSEWDMMEVLNGESTIYSTLHCGTAPGGPCNEWTGLSNAPHGGEPFTRDVWHEVAFMVDRDVKNSTSSDGTSTAAWENESISWWLDGKKQFEVKGSDVGDFGAWEETAHLGHFLLVNVAVGGNWPGPPNNLTLGGEKSSFELDYVGVWNSV